MVRSKTYPHYQKGVTFIELIIVLSVIVILSTLSLSSYRNFNEDRKLELEAQKLIETFELAKKKTISGDKPCGSFQGTYTVSWTISSYTLTPDGCSNLMTYRFPGSIVLTTNSSVTFQPFGRGSDEASIIMKHVKKSVCRNVTLNGAGTADQDIITCP